MRIYAALWLEDVHGSFLWSGSWGVYAAVSHQPFRLCWPHRRTQLTHTQILYPYRHGHRLPTDFREKVGNILNILWSAGAPPLSSPPCEPPLLCPAVHTHTYTPAENRNNVLNAIIVRPKQCHLSREHLGLYNKFHIINTIFHPLSSLSDLWHMCDLRWSLNYNSSNKRENGPGLLLLPTGAHTPTYTQTHKPHKKTWINNLQL